MQDVPSLGVGIGLRRKHFATLPETRRQLDWVEFTPENYMAFGGRPLQALDACKTRWPLVAHSVNLNLGGTAPLKEDYLHALKTLLDRADALWYSDHLCWSEVPGRNTHELLPLPFTWEAVHHVVERIKRVQAFIERPMAIENVSAYLRLPDAELTEAQFTAEILERADCGLLLDVNNVYVNSLNHDEDPWSFFHNIPMERVYQVHLAGHELRCDVIIDTHEGPICDDVWALFEAVAPKLPRHSILIEWDSAIPNINTYLDEADRARAVLQRALKAEGDEHAIG